MRCNSCCIKTNQIICPSCYRQYSKHHSQRRTCLVNRHEQIKKKFQQLVQTNLHLGNSIALSNRKILAVNAQNTTKHDLLTKKDLLHRKIKENQLLRQRIKQKMTYLQKIERQAKRIRLQIKQKERVQKQLKNNTEKRCKKIKGMLQMKIGLIINYVKVNRFVCSKEQWFKFISMREQSQKMYEQLMECQYGSQLTIFHNKIKSQMIALFTISQLLHIALPYKIDYKHLLKNNANSLLFQYTKQGQRLNKERLRQFQANTIYLFSRFNIIMEYPQIDSESLSTITAQYIQKRLRIAQYMQLNNLTQPIYISSKILEQQQMKESMQVVEHSNISGLCVVSNGIGIVSDQVICEQLVQLRADYIRKYIEEESTNEMDFTQILELKDSDEEIEILQ